MIRIQVPGNQTENFGHDSSWAVRDAIESKIHRLRFALDRSNKTIADFEEKYHFPSTDLLLGKSVEDLASHEDFLAWEGEIHIHSRILEELDTLEHVVYEHS